MSALVFGGGEKEVVLVLCSAGWDGAGAGAVAV
jgi:hypothetical protein